MMTYPIPTAKFAAGLRQTNIHYVKFWSMPWSTGRLSRGTLRRVVRGVEIHEGKALVRDEDLHTELVRLLDHGEPDCRILEREPLTVRTPRGVHLERRDVPGRDLRAHVVEFARQRPEVRL